MELVYKEETFKIIGACMTVHSEMGSGFLESVYHEALENELQELEMPYVCQKKIAVFHKGKQLINYLKATKYKIGLLVNFGESSLQWKRFINTPAEPQNFNL